jgi:hypothetical protein
MFNDIQAPLNLHNHVHTTKSVALYSIQIIKIFIIDNSQAPLHLYKYLHTTKNLIIDNFQIIKFMS